MRKPRRFSGLALSVLILPGLSCGGSEVSGPPSPTAPTPSVDAAPPESVTAITVTGDVPRAGGSAQFVATATLPNGSTQVITSHAAWSSSDDYVATVGAFGLVSANTAGETEIAAAYKGVTGARRLAVVGLPACGTAPGPRNQVAPLFSSPLQVASRGLNDFDHEFALGWLDTNGHQLNACGDKDKRKTDGHMGIDFFAPVGTPIYAVGEGRVLFADLDREYICPPLGGRMTRTPLIRIQHPVIDGRQYVSWYYHMSRIDVHVGDAVTRGQQIGLIGSVGCIIGEAVHVGFERLSNGMSRTPPTFVDPYGWEGPGADPWATHSGGADSVWLWRPGEAPRIQ